MICPKREKSGSTSYFAEVLFLYTVIQYGGLWGIVVGTYLNFLEMFWCASRARTHIIAVVEKCLVTITLSRYTWEVVDPITEVSYHTEQIHLAVNLRATPQKPIFAKNCYCSCANTYEPIRLAHFGRFETHVTYVCTTGSAADVDKMNSCLHPRQ